MLQNLTAEGTGMAAVAGNSGHGGFLSVLDGALMDGDFVTPYLLSSRVPAVCQPLCRNCEELGA